MNSDDHDRDERNRALDLLAAAANAELALLRKERKAERRLADAFDSLARDRARLRNIQQRVERSSDAVAAAEARLREAQANRAAGPGRTQD